MKSDVVIVGGGIAGLTAAAFLSKAGKSVLLLEKEKTCGGLINSFERDGFVYDGGIRATENSGVLFPMLKKLGLNIPLVKNHVSIGMEDRVIRVQSEDDLFVYQDLLNHFYPQNRDEIEKIIQQIKKIMHFMDVQYGIDNPAFLDIQEDRDYFIKEIFPWMFKYAFTAPRISKMNEPVEDFLKRYTQNQSLLDIISQHFFTKTPAFFALSYLKIYLDYHYPLGGTGSLINAMISKIHEYGGEIRNEVEISCIDPENQVVRDTNNQEYGWHQLIWAADQKAFYNFVDMEIISNQKEKAAVAARKNILEDKTGNQSVYTLYLAVDMKPEYFGNIASEHFFYTPLRTGESAAGPLPYGNKWPEVREWLEKFMQFTTYEISIPVLRDSSLAPEGKTGLIISMLFDYQLTRQIEAAGKYEEMKTLCEETMLHILDQSIYPGLKDAVIHHFSSSPLTMLRHSGNSDGAITGWSFTNDPMPAESRLPRIYSSVKTPLRNVLQAGQWTYSPSGLPISILTGKLAADSAINALKKKKR